MAYPKPIKAKYSGGVCPACGCVVKQGQLLVKGKSGWQHQDCNSSKNIIAAEGIETRIKGFILTAENQAIHDHIMTSENCLLVKARAGTGKTSQIEYSLYHYIKANPFARILYCCFNRIIAAEARQRFEGLPITISTIHAQGYSEVSHARRKSRVDTTNWKIRNLYQDYCKSYGIEHDYKMGYRLADYVSLAKNSLVEEVNDLIELSAHHGLNLDGDSINAIMWLLEKSKSELLEAIPFDDMVWLVASQQITPQSQFDLIVIDEVQDLSPAQYMSIIQYLAPEGKIVLVGDDAQAVYGFTGADSDALGSFQTILNPDTLPLTTNYRCGKAIINLVNQTFPQWEIKAGVSWDGMYSETSYDQMIQVLASHPIKTTVLCRNNAPLVKPCFDLIKMGVQARIQNREDVGKSLLKLWDKFSTGDLSETIMILLEKLEGKAGYKDSLWADKLETLLEFCYEASSCSDVAKRISQIFDDTGACEDGIVFSTIHSFKGKQNDRVFFLLPKLIPSKYASQEWQFEQEKHLIYIAMTRAKIDLLFVNDHPNY